MIDPAHPANQQPAPEPEDFEFIENILVPLENLWEECKILEDQGLAIDARVGVFAQGLKISKDYSLWVHSGPPSTP